MELRGNLHIYSHARNVLIIENDALDFSTTAPHALDSLALTVFNQPKCRKQINCLRCK